MTKKSQETKARILKTARKLFARQGVDNTSLRAITAEADVNLAAINYHFGGKDALVTEVLMGFIYPLDAECRQILEDARQAAPDGIPQVKDTVTAFIQPWLNFMARHPGMIETYIQRHTNGNAKVGAGNSMAKMLYTIAETPYRDFTAGIARALPAVPEETLTLRINIAITTASSVLLTPWFNNNLEAVSGFALNRDNLLDFLTRFIETGKFE